MDQVGRSKGYLNLRNTRRLVQLLSAGLWIYLFFMTRVKVSALPVDIFIATDPLIAAITLGAAQILVPSLVAGLILAVFTMIFGRFFCGWLCPLGLILDGAAKIFPPDPGRFSKKTSEKMHRWKYYLLVAILFGSLLSSQWAYLFDPLVILYRGLATGIYPVYAAIMPQQALPGELGADFHEVVFIPLALLLGVIGLTALAPRFYCRYICPLGALYGVLARKSLFRRRVTDACDACKPFPVKTQCKQSCRMDAIPSNTRHTRNHECIRCFTGHSECHQKGISFEFVGLKKEKVDKPINLGRRQFIITGAAGLSLAPVVSLAHFHRRDPRLVVRPPRVLDEDTFLDQCVRCGMCVQACPTQTLQFTFLDSGLAGLWTPALTPRIGGCIADCNACGRVCPTGAIPQFKIDEGDKWSVKMGTAVLEKGRCISYADNLACKKCIDICPTKAFIAEPSDGTHPYRPVSIDYVRCVGCGLCEFACRKIVFGKPAVLTFSHGQGQPTVLRDRPTSDIQGS